MNVFSIIAISSLAYVCFLAWLETARPFRAPTESRSRHICRHFFIKIVNQVIAGVQVALTLGLAYWVQEHTSLGLRYWIDWPDWLEFIIVILLMDLVVYGTHVLHHRIPLLWKFHRAHHSDHFVDASTAFRFHPGEVITTTFLQTIAFGTLGIGVSHAITYFILIHLITPFHHSNIRISETVDRFLRCVIVSPLMHRVHHSDIRTEHDHNYSNVFSCWDFLFRTYLKRDNKTLTYGVNELPEQRWQKLPGIYATPIAEFLKPSP